MTEERERRPFRRGDRIRIRPEWQDPGDDEFGWVAVVSGLNMLARALTAASRGFAAGKSISQRTRHIKEGVTEGQDYP